MNPSVDLLNAIKALGFKRQPRFVNVREGVEIHQLGRPVLLLTWSAVQAFANACEEAAANG